MSGTGLLGYLKDQLPGGGDHQNPGRSGLPPALDGVVQHPGNNGDEKGRCLAGAGLGPAAGVLAGQGAGKNFGLDRRTILETQIMNGVHQRIGEDEIVKAGLAFGRRDLEL